MIQEQDIKDFLQDKNLDIRKTKNARFFDQKITPDVLSIVAECIIETIKEDIYFSNNDIMYSDFAKQNIPNFFNKPSIEDDNTKREYDKFFGQSLKMLSYANILSEKKESNKNIYQIYNKEILEYIALRDRNAYSFISIYLELVIKQSDIDNEFEKFFINNNKDSFNTLKSFFVNFIKEHTSISQDYEPKRIFTKILNPLCFKRKKLGTKMGKISNEIINYNDLLYNQPNWRDKLKPKNITRNEWSSIIKEDIEKDSSYEYCINKAKRFVKKIHEYSEIHNLPKEDYKALHAHHIFPMNEFPEIADKPENIIAITPNQHFMRAHPNNNTKQIDKSYQAICLISKLDSIEKDNFYNKNNYNIQEFIDVINIGLNTNFDKNLSYESLKHNIIYEYCKV